MESAAFATFIAELRAALATRMIELTVGDERSGSVVIPSRGERREWIFHDLAALCAKVDVARWPAMIEQTLARPELEGPVDGRAHPTPTVMRAWVIGTTDWGGVVLEDGSDGVVVVLLPLRDGVEAAAPQMSVRVSALIVCNGDDAGTLATTATARALGIQRVYAIDPTRAVDRPTPAADVDPVVAQPIPDGLEMGQLQLSARGNSISGRWSNGANVLVGPAVTVSLISEVLPENILGGFTFGADDGGPGFLDVLTKGPRVTLMANVMDVDEARRVAHVLANVGMQTEVAHIPPAPRPLRVQIRRHIIAGDLMRAEAIAHEAIAANDDADDARYQLGVIALMRDDEDSALAAFQVLSDDPRAANSRALILAGRHDPRASGEALRAVAGLPGDVIAIRGAIQVHRLLGDRDGAEAVLREHGDHFDESTRARLEEALAADREPGAQPLQHGAHQFPEHAQLVAEMVGPMLDAGRYADAIPLLERASRWDPDNRAVAAALRRAVAGVNDQVRR